RRSSSPASATRWRLRPRAAGSRRRCPAPGSSRWPARRTCRSCPIATRSSPQLPGSSMAADPRFAAPDPRDVDPRAVQRAFARAAATYDTAAVLQREVAARLAERLDYVRIAPAVVVDAGCGTGHAMAELAARY